MVAARKFTTGPVGELSYLEWRGDPARTPILFLHPVNTAATVWNLVAEQFGSDRTLIAPDYRAHGESEASGPYFPADYAADARAVLAAAGISRAHLVVGSIGGAVAAELAAAVPDAVASISTFGATLRLLWADPDLDAAVESLRELGVRAWFDRHGADILGPDARPEAGDELTAVASAGRFGDRTTDVVVDVLITTFGRADSRPAASIVAFAPPPAQVLVGTDDPTCPLSAAEELASYLGATVQVIDGIGHLPMLEDPVGTAASVKTFLANLEVGA
jgi:pimeloyl-ACP methyl ester carboxylesterase